MAKGNKSVKHLDSHRVNQIKILRVLSPESKTYLSQRQVDINTIAQLSGVRDEKETQRYLYILEGHKLVSPHPAGDFTSKLWHITDDGVRAFKSISSEFAI